MNVGCVKAVIIGGLIGGAGDLAYALAWAGAHGTAPVTLLQVVASGAFGQAAFDGGMATAAAGFGFHFLMSLLWACVLVLAARRMPALARRPVLAAGVFGLLVFLAMRLVVLPLSAFPFPVRFKPLGTALDLASHVFLFALPMVLAARRFCVARAR